MVSNSTPSDDIKSSIAPSDDTKQLAAAEPESAAQPKFRCWKESDTADDHVKSTEGGLLDRFKESYQLFRKSTMAEHYACFKTTVKEVTQKFMPKGDVGSHSAPVAKDVQSSLQ